MLLTIEERFDEQALSRAMLAMARWTRAPT
jgi:hypothetical protein